METKKSIYHHTSHDGRDMVITIEEKLPPLEPGPFILDFNRKEILDKAVKIEGEFTVSSLAEARDKIIATGNVPAYVLMNKKVYADTIIVGENGWNEVLEPKTRYSLVVDRGHVAECLGLQFFTDAFLYEERRFLPEEVLILPMN